MASPGRAFALPMAPARRCHGLARWLPCKAPATARRRASRPFPHAKTFAATCFCGTMQRHCGADNAAGAICCADTGLAAIPSNSLFIFMFFRVWFGCELYKRDGITAWFAALPVLVCHVTVFDDYDLQRGRKTAIYRLFLLWRRRCGACALLRFVLLFLLRRSRRTDLFFRASCIGSRGLGDVRHGNDFVTRACILLARVGRQHCAVRRASPAAPVRYLLWWRWAWLYP